MSSADRAFGAPLRAVRALAAACLIAALAASAAAAQEHEMSSGDQKLTIRGFTDFTYLTGGHETGRTSAFGLGQFDLYMTSQVSGPLSFLSETVFEYDEESSEFVVDVERVIAQYAIDDHLRLDVGKVHTPLGYWNNAYHHGLVMQPTIDRPQLVQFEDDDGPLPVHTVGVEFSGRDLTSAHLGFDALLGNPLGNRPTSDNRNGATSVTLAVHSQVTTSLRVGLSGYRDQLETGSPTPRGDSLAAPMTQTIGGGFLAYFGERAETIVELHDIANESAGRTSSSPNWFAYAGLRVGGRFVPYLMHEDLDLKAGDPYFAPDNMRRETLGVRYEQAASAVYKMEVRSTDRRSFKRATELALQLAIAF